MGSVVKAVTKPFKSVAKAIGGVVGTLTGQKAQPQTIVNEAPAAAPAAPAAPQVVQQAQQGSDETSGESSERVARKGKRSLTIRRTNIGGGSGLNV